MIFCSTSTSNLSVEIPEKLIKKLITACKLSYPYECGGILIGYYTENCTSAIVSSITNQKGNHRTRFFRDESGLIRLLNKQWSKGYYYIGEWHYHPDSSSRPSTIDINTMRKLSMSNGLKCPEPILMIIGGKDGNWNYNLSITTKDSYIPLCLK